LRQSHARVVADARFFRVRFPARRAKKAAAKRVVIGDSMLVDRMTHSRRWHWRIAAALSFFASTGASAAWEWTFQPAVTPLAREIISLHSLIFWICVVIFVGVFGTMFYSLFKHRKSIGHQAVQFHENTTVEIVWTVIPFLILLFMAYPATKTILAALGLADAACGESGARTC